MRAIKKYSSKFDLPSLRTLHWTTVGTPSGACACLRFAGWNSANDGLLTAGLGSATCLGGGLLARSVRGPEKEGRLSGCLAVCGCFCGFTEGFGMVNDGLGSEKEGRD
jgi:hypothetical protein